MARTTSQSKAKTKTAKKPVAAKATKAVKTTTKKAVKPVKAAAKKETKVVAKPAAKAASVRKPSAVGRLLRSATPSGLRKLHVASALIYVVLAIVAGALMKAVVSVPLTVGYVTRNELLSTTNTVFAPAQHVLYNLDLRWAVIAVLAVSAFFSLLRMTRLEVAESEGLKIKVQPWRWVDLAVTGAVMVEVAAALYGIQSLDTLKLVGALTVFSLVLAWIAERENSGATKFVKGAYVASIVSGLVVFAVFASYGWATMVYGMVRFPWYAYALFASSVVTAALVTVNQYKGFRGVKTWANYLFVERNYLLISLASKVAFAVILIVGLHR